MTIPQLPQQYLNNPSGPKVVPMSEVPSVTHVSGPEPI